MSESKPSACPICAAPIVIPPELVIPRTTCRQCMTVIARARRHDGSPYLIAVDGPEHAKIRARWHQLRAVKKWGTLLFLGAVLFFTISLPWALGETTLRDLGNVLLLIQLVICTPLGFLFQHLVMLEYRGEFNDPPRRRSKPR